MKRLGIALIILQQTCFAVENAAIHQVGHGLSLTQFSFLRSTGGLLIVLCMLPSVGWAGLKTTQPKVTLMRGGVSIAYSFVMMFSLVSMPLADATSLSYTQAIYMVLFAPLILGEVVGMQRYAAVFIGMAGSLVLIKPSFSGTSLIYLAVLLGTSFNALAVVISRYLQRQDHPVSVMFWANIMMVVFFAAPAMTTPWPSFDLTQMLWLLPIAVIGPLGMYLGIVAFKYADAATLAPFTYSRLVAISVIAPMLFGEIPDGYNLIGTVIIVLACILATAAPQPRLVLRPAKA